MEGSIGRAGKSFDLKPEGSKFDAIDIREYERIYMIMSANDEYRFCSRMLLNGILNEIPQ